MSTETGKRLSGRLGKRAPITASTSMFYVAKAGAMNTVRTARTYGYDGAQHMIEESPALHSEPVDNLRCAHLARRSD